MFSRGGQDADALLEDLIAAERAPRELLVVSSDHRIQRAARQRGAKYADSDEWLRELHSRRPLTTSKPEGPSQSSAELQQWLAEFGDVDSRRLEPVDPPPPSASLPSPVVESPSPKAKSGKKKADKGTSDDEKPQSRWNPFPPGYGEDLL